MMPTNVSMPPEFVATRFPGYFWNTKTQTLFTAKLGVLRQLKMVGPNKYNMLTEYGYRVSHQGHKKFMPLRYLKGIKPVHTVFPVEFVTVKSGANDDVAVSMANLPPGTRVRVSIEG